MPSAGFEPAIATVKRPQTYALDRMATGTDCGLLHHAISE
jgi:hypothetical protein